MKVGRLFENALKQAKISLKPGSEVRVKVQRSRGHLRLVVQDAGMNEFERTVIERSKKAKFDELASYHPKIPVGERIRTIRKSAGLTLSALASKTGMTKGNLCSIEKGSRPVGLATLKKISNALGVSITIFVDGL